MKISDNFCREKNLSYKILIRYTLKFYAFILIFGISKKMAIQKGGPFEVVAH